MSGNIELLAGVLARAKRENRAALIGGLPAGFPTVDGGIAAIQTVLNSGADIVEIGLPHTDPVLDGPVIQTADDIALRGGVRIGDVIRTVREAHRATGKPVLVMSYWNPIARYGLERFAARAGRGRRRGLHPARPARCRNPRRGAGHAAGPAASPPSSWSRRAAPANDCGRSPRPARGSSTRPR